MLPRFCRLYYKAIDESIINVRKCSFTRNKRVTSTSEYYYKNDDPDFEKQEMPKDPEVEEVQPTKKKCYIVKCKRPQFDFYQGQVYSKFEPIPMTSRGWHNRKSKGDHFTIYPHNQEEVEEINTSLTFNDFNLSDKLIKNLEANNLFHPTQIQELGIKKILSGVNVALTAETGCGKTYAFLIPLIEQILKWKILSKDRGVNKPLGLILTPSKELTLQIAKVAKNLCKGLDINIIKFISGQTKNILRNPPIGEVDILIATVGIMNKLLNSKIFSLDDVKSVILDEADTLLDETFSEETCSILIKAPLGANRINDNEYPKTAQLILNSATIPQNLHLNLENIINPDSIEKVTTGYEHQVKVPQKFYRLLGSEKPMMLLKLVKFKAKNKIPVIIFSNTTETCDFTNIFLQQFGVSCIRLHKKMPLEVRKGKIMDFQLGKHHVLTTTDAGARGIDTTVAKDVINFDFPLITAEYIHRCGRVGRIGSPKDCIIHNFISKPLEIVLASKIEYAAKKMNPIPMVDFIHDKYDEEGQFLSGDKNVHTTEWDETEDDANSEAKDYEYSLPQ